MLGLSFYRCVIILSYRTKANTTQIVGISHVCHCGTSRWIVVIVEPADGLTCWASCELSLCGNINSEMLVHLLGLCLTMEGYWVLVIYNILFMYVLLTTRSCYGMYFYLSTVS